MLLGKPSSGKRWPRGQKFTLSTAGAAAEVDYRAAVSSARASGRAALDAALSAWAGSRGLAPADGVVLAELSGKRVGLNALIESLEPAGILAEDVRAAIGRLVAAGVVDPLPPPSRAADSRA
jgi:hypothetical protein